MLTRLSRSTALAMALSVAGITAAAAAAPAPKLISHNMAQPKTAALSKVQAHGMSSTKKNFMAKNKFSNTKTASHKFASVGGDAKAKH